MCRVRAWPWCGRARRSGTLIKYSLFNALKAAGGAIRTRWPTMEYLVWHLALSVLIHVSICYIDLDVPVLRSVGLGCIFTWLRPLSLIPCTPSHFLMNAIAVPLISLSFLRIRASSARPNSVINSSLIVPFDH
ncbi:hypothetical protein DFH08DRAFT_899043 [Mycena albidolilacea]|uniref:Uncharacterized protein n=1 Tax=Mycena albidolilacea TaxID=1033008 RepID=A0AAD6Z6C6_9AGAR|nr:hypothetical protein DFH08DRAFT_899043 [Mycena albidolilacea]